MREDTNKRHTLVREINFKEGDSTSLNPTSNPFFLISSTNIGESCVHIVCHLDYLFIIKNDDCKTLVNLKMLSIF